MTAARTLGVNMLNICEPTHKTKKNTCTLHVLITLLLTIYYQKTNTQGSGLIK